MGQKWSYGQPLMYFDEDIDSGAEKQTKNKEQGGELMQFFDETPTANEGSDKNSKHSSSGIQLMEFFDPPADEKSATSNLEESSAETTSALDGEIVGKSENDFKWFTPDQKLKATEPLNPACHNPLWYETLDYYTTKFKNIHARLTNDREIDSEENDYVAEPKIVAQPQQNFSPTKISAHITQKQTADLLKAKETNKVLTPDSVVTKKERKYIKPIEVAYKVAATGLFKVLDFVKIFMFDGNTFRLVKTAELKVEIMKICGNLIAICGSERFVTDVSKFLMIFPELQVNSDSLPKDIVGFNNGTLNLTTGAFLPPSPTRFITFNINCEYGNFSNDCPIFSSFIEFASGGDVLLMQRIWEVIGYCLTPDTAAKKIFVFQGISNSGKSLLINVISLFFHDESKTALQMPEFERNFAISELFNKHICVVSELTPESLRPNAVSVLKELSGNDMITADVKYSDRISFRCKAKLLLTTNHPIYTKYADNALLNRLVVVPFKYAVPEENMDQDILEKIRPEMNAIARIALQHYQELVKRKYVFSGHFPLNDAVSGTMLTETKNIFDELYNYILSNFSEDSNCFVFSEDIKNLFETQYVVTSEKEFYNKLAIVMEMLPFKVQKAKARKVAGGTTQNCYKGIRFTGGGKFE